jgi:hypothetical protein
MPVNSLETRMNCGSLFVCVQSVTMEAKHLSKGLFAKDTGMGAGK